MLATLLEWQPHRVDNWVEERKKDSMLRIVATLWVAFLSGSALTLAFLLLTQPFASETMEGSIGASIFVAGCFAGYLAASRLFDFVSQLRARRLPESPQAASVQAR